MTRQSTIHSKTRLTVTEGIRNLPKRNDPVLRVVPGPADINANGHIFGGWVLGVMDQAGGILAGRIAQGACATVAIEKMEFIAPILLRDIISVYASLERRGRTSMGIRIEVIATRARGQQEVKVTEGLFTFVALDEEHKPRALPEG
jgi:acyl-CoA thioesterase YciA